MDAQDIVDAFCKLKLTGIDIRIVRSVPVQVAHSAAEAKDVFLHTIVSCWAIFVLFYDRNPINRFVSLSHHSSGRGRFRALPAAHSFLHDDDAACIAREETLRHSIAVFHLRSVDSSGGIHSHRQSDDRRHTGAASIGTSAVRRQRRAYWPFTSAFVTILLTTRRRHLVARRC